MTCHVKVNVSVRLSAMVRVGIVLDIAVWIKVGVGLCVVRGRGRGMFLDMIGNMVGVGKGRWVGIAVGV